MIIRSAKLSDYEEIMNLYNLFVGNDRYSKHDNDSYKKVLNNTKNHMFLAVEDRRIIGYATISLKDVIRYPKPIVELDELFVLAEYRKHGIGRQLMDHVEKKSRELNCQRIFISSHYKHKTAHAFYESIGYTNYGYHFIKDL